MERKGKIEKVFHEEDPPAEARMAQIITPFLLLSIFNLFPGFHFGFAHKFVFLLSQTRLIGW